MLNDERLMSLKETIRSCNKCSLKENTALSCWDNGNYNSGLLFVGEAPGATEALHGIPFIGRAGKYLNKCLLAIGIDRKDIFITNTCMCRPVLKSTNKDRPPSSDEINNCSDYLSEQISIISPKLIVTLGRVPFQVLTNSNDAIMKAKGNLYSYKDNINIKIFPLMHPSYILTYGTDSIIQDNWNDWLHLKETIVEFDIQFNK